MSSKAKFQAIRGTRDLLPPDTALWNRVEQTAHEVFSTYGFGEIRLPIFEGTELFARAVGLDTDIVGKEMFILNQDYDNKTSLDLDHLRKSIKFMAVSLADEQSFENFREAIAKFSDEYKTALKQGHAYQYEYAHVGFGYLDGAISLLAGFLRGPKPPGWQDVFRGVAAQALDYLDRILLEASSALRPEATATRVPRLHRTQHAAVPQPVKLYYMGPMFRRERPQKGRYRQFYQIGAEILGGPDAPAIDAELIEMLMTFFDKCGLQGTELRHQFDRPQCPAIDGNKLPPRLRRKP